MKFLYILFLTSAFLGCNSNSRPAGSLAIDNNDLRTYIDPNTNVICYRVVGFQGLSCLQINGGK